MRGLQWRLLDPTHFCFVASPDDPLLMALQTLSSQNCASTVTDLTSLTDDHQSAQLAALVARLCTGAQEVAGSIASLCWDRLEAGGWPHVCWREAHILAQLTLAWAALECGDYEEAMRCADIAIIFGAPKEITSVFVAAIEPSARTTQMTATDVRLICPWKRLPDQLAADLEGTMPAAHVHQGSMPVSQFKNQYYRKGEPVVLRGAAKHWAGLEQWNQVDWIMRELGHRTVPVEIGRHLKGENWREQLMTVRSFVDQFIVPSALQLGCSRWICCWEGHCRVLHTRTYLYI